MSSCFERVSRVEIKPNELHAYAKNIGTLNTLCLEILKNFVRVSLRFCNEENLQQHPIHFYIDNEINPGSHHPSSTQIHAIIRISTCHHISLQGPMATNQHHFSSK